MSKLISTDRLSEALLKTRNFMINLVSNYEPKFTILPVSKGGTGVSNLSDLKNEIFDTGNTESVVEPVYVDEVGTPTIGTRTIGSNIKPTYLSSGTVTALGSTVGSTTMPIWVNAGAYTALTQANLRIGVFGVDAIGSATRPVYIGANGVPTEGSAYPTTLPPNGSAGGELGGTYPNPTLNNNAVISKTLTGLTSSTTELAATDSIITAFGKLMGRINSKQSTISAGTAGRLRTSSGTAGTLNELAVDVGSATLPIYIKSGIPTAITQADLRKGVIGTTAVGSINQPVYFAANGVPTPANSYPSTMTQEELDTGTSTDTRTITPKILADLKAELKQYTDDNAGQDGTDGSDGGFTGNINFGDYGGIELPDTISGGVLLGEVTHTLGHYPMATLYQLNFGGGIGMAGIGPAGGSTLLQLGALFEISDRDKIKVYVKTELGVYSEVSQLTNNMWAFVNPDPTVYTNLVLVLR